MTFDRWNAHSSLEESGNEGYWRSDEAGAGSSGAHAAKDSGIALALAASQSLNLPLAQATFDQYEKMIELGIGELDKSGIAELTFPGRKGSE